MKNYDENTARSNALPHRHIFPRLYNDGEERDIAKTLPRLESSLPEAVRSSVDREGLKISAL